MNGVDFAKDRSGASNLFHSQVYWGLLTPWNFAVKNIRVMTHYICLSGNVKGERDARPCNVFFAAGIRRDLFMMLFACTGSLHAAPTAPATWFPDSPTFRYYAWEDPPCPGCETLVPRPAWSRMVSLAGIT